jgi:hypothetical protein
MSSESDGKVSVSIWLSGNQLRLNPIAIRASRRAVKSTLESLSASGRIDAELIERALYK